MADDAPLLAKVSFSSLTQRRINYENQTEIDKDRVDKLSVAAMFYGLDIGLVARYFIGADKILRLSCAEYLPLSPCQTQITSRGYSQTVVQLNLTSMSRMIPKC